VAYGNSVCAETGLWPFQRNRRRRTVLAAGEKRGFRPRAKPARGGVPGNRLRFPGVPI